jgi:hypothetical protein
MKIPDLDHVMRFVPKQLQIRDSETDEFLGIVADAFRLRAEDDGGLSVTWIEHYGPKSNETYVIAANGFRESRRTKTISKSAYFVVGNIGNAKSVALRYGKKIRVLHDPVEGNSGHAEMRRFTNEDLQLLEALNMEVFVEHVAVSTLI